MSKLIVSKESPIYKNFLQAQEAQAVLDGLDAVVKANEKIVKAYKELIKDEVDKAKLNLADSPILICVDNRGKEVILATDKLGASSEFDKKQLAIDLPALLAKYTTPTFKHGITLTANAKDDNVTVIAG